MLLLNDSSTEVHALAMVYIVKCDMLAIFATYKNCQNRDSCRELVFSTSSAFTNLEILRQIHNFHKNREAQLLRFLPFIAKNRNFRKNHKNRES